MSHKNLNKELLDYAKMQVDTEVLTVLNHLSKMIFIYSEKDFSFSGINKILSLQKEDVKDCVINKNYFGFQVLKSWELNELAFFDILKNPFVLSRLHDDQIIAIIRLLKGLRIYDQLFKNTEVLFLKTKQESTGYKIVKGEELNPEENTKFKKRFLLLKDIGDGKFQVEDFGDFPKYYQSELLNIFVLKDSAIDFFAATVYDTLSDINRWLDLTGKELVIDTKMFKIGVLKEKPLHND